MGALSVFNRKENTPCAREQNGISGNEPSITVAEHDAPPDGGYGWTVCAALANLNGFTWGVAAVRSVLLLLLDVSDDDSLMECI